MSQVEAKKVEQSPADAEENDYTPIVETNRVGIKVSSCLNLRKGSDSCNTQQS